MMDQAISMDISGIKCDTQGCDYFDESVKVEDYAEWIDKPCPKCGGNLLTKEDFDTVQATIALVNMMNGILPPPSEDEQLFKASFGLNGSGDIIDFNMEKAEEDE